MSMTLYYKRKEKGLCTKCGDIAREGKTTCKKCLDRDIEHNKERRAKLKLLGLCISCGHEEAEPNKTKCWECAEKDRIASENRRKKPEIKKIVAEYDKDRYQRNKENGICTHCGKKPKEKGLVCISCHNKKLANQRRYKDRHGIERDLSRSERIAYGMCYICGKNAMQGKGVCEEHYKQREDSIKKICYFSVSDEWKEDNKAVYKKVGS